MILFKIIYIVLYYVIEYIYLFCQADEYGNYFEGDMDLDDDQIQDLYRSIVPRNGIINTKHHWPNKVVHYHLSDSFTKAQKNAITQAMNTIQAVSCVRFARKTYQQNFVYITVSIFVHS